MAGTVPRFVILILWLETEIVPKSARRNLYQALRNKDFDQDGPKLTVLKSYLQQQDLLGLHCLR